MSDMTVTEILQRIHKIKRAALTTGAAPAVTLALDTLADEITFGVAPVSREGHGTYSTPRQCDHPDCAFVTDSRNAYWDHMVQVHGA